MKKLLLTIKLIIVSLVIFGQQWTGSTTTDDNIWRNGNVGIGVSPNHRLHVQGSHGNSRILLHSTGGGTEDRYADLMLWASEPGISYSGVGIGNNVINLSTSPYIQRISNIRGGSYIRLLDGSIRMNVIKNDGSDINSFNIDVAGNVGIGTKTPKAALHVETSGSFLRLSNNSSNYLYSGIDGLGIYFEHVADSPEKSQIRFQTRNSNQGLYSQFFIDGANSRFNFVNGNVGIGTTSPNAKLDVRGTAAFNDENIIDVVISTPSGKNGLVFSPNTYGNYSRFDLVNYDNTNESDRYFLLKFNQDAGGIAIKKGGNVCIGTTVDNGYKLAVEGTIGAREIKVEAGAWSDFVFNKDYELKDLEEVENFIEENKHLPDIPSEKEVVENGIQVGEMNAKLLQKIEELTLYMIEQNKETKKLIQKVETLESKNVALESEIKELKSE